MGQDGRTTLHLLLPGNCYVLQATKGGCERLTLPLPTRPQWFSGRPTVYCNHDDGSSHYMQIAQMQGACFRAESAPKAYHCRVVRPESAEDACAGNAVEKNLSARIVQELRFLVLSPSVLWFLRIPQPDVTPNDLLTGAVPEPEQHEKRYSPRLGPSR